MLHFVKKSHPHHLFLPCSEKQWPSQYMKFLLGIQTYVKFNFFFFFYTQRQWPINFWLFLLYQLVMHVFISISWVRVKKWSSQSNTLSGTYEYVSLCLEVKKGLLTSCSWGMHRVGNTQNASWSLVIILELAAGGWGGRATSNWHAIFVTHAIGCQPEC